MSRLHGLSIDNLVEVEMVLADGRIVIVSENEYPGISPIRLFNCNLMDLIGDLQIYGGDSGVQVLV